MLFHCSEEKIDRIPSSYIVVMVSKKDVADHEGLVGCRELIPCIIPSVDKDKRKKKYVRDLKKDPRKEAFITSMLMQLNMGSDVVFVYTKDEKEKYGFNYCKALCQYIEDRFGYPGYKFTNDTTLEMKRDSKFSSNGMLEYMDVLEQHAGVLRGGSV